MVVVKESLWIGLLVVTMTTGATAFPQQKIQASDRNSGGHFGGIPPKPTGPSTRTVAMSGRWLVVSGLSKTQQQHKDVGTVYVFARDVQGHWKQEAMLHPSEKAGEYTFGKAISIDGDKIAVGAPGLRNVYVFVRHASNGTWTQEAKMWVRDQSVDLGYSVAISGERLVAGTTRSGAYVFSRDILHKWAQSADFPAPQRQPARGPGFGSSLDFDGVRILIGSPAEGDASSQGKGAAYIFTETKEGSDHWVQESRLIPTTTKLPSFGTAVAIDGNLCVVSNTDGAFVYQRNATSHQWELDAEMTDRDYRSTGFGNSVDLSEGRVLVGNNQEQQFGGTGSAYLFMRSSIDGAWKQEAKLRSADLQAHDWFGYAVAIDVDHAVIGAGGESTGASSAGAAYVFNLGVEAASCGDV